MGKLPPEPQSEYTRETFIKQWWVSVFLNGLTSMLTSQAYKEKGFSYFRKNASRQ